MQVGAEADTTAQKVSDVLKVFRLPTSHSAQVPTKGSPAAAGYDLFSAEDITIPSYTQAVVRTGIGMEIPEGYYGRIAPRSGLAVRENLWINAGVVDSDYRGEILPVVYNNSHRAYEVKAGDRIAQIIIEKIGNFSIQVVDADSVGASQRGSAGFGSTGK